MNLDKEKLKNFEKLPADVRREFSLLMNQYGQKKKESHIKNDFMSFDTLEEFNQRRRWERIVTNVLENPEFYACVTSLNRKTFSIK